jgi:DNA-binding NtrC family response regulator
MSKRSALVAEDSHLGGWAISHALRGVGFDVRRAATWVEVTGWLRMQPFRVLVLSASLDPSGVKAMVTYMAANHVETAVIVLADADDVRSLGRECGSQAVVVSKPLDLDRLAGMASTYLRDQPVALRA